LKDAVALEKDIAQANESVLAAEREHESLYSTVAQVHIRMTLIEDYRAPLELSLPAAKFVCARRRRHHFFPLADFGGSLRVWLAGFVLGGNSFLPSAIRVAPFPANPLDSPSVGDALNGDKSK
jgi:hypothetical protein